MPRPCRVGIQLPEVERRVGWPELFSMARTAEGVGFDSLWLGDHLLYDLPGGVTRGPWEAWTALGVAFGCVRGLLAGVANCRLAWWSLIGAIGEPGTAG
jgi:alkanesulfonate monooxygenase SsuD/methylene tetrahydromethanopterin reductase-like flavin-dependent oxidoreductase (luciferase family)